MDLEFAASREILSSFVIVAITGRIKFQLISIFNSKFYWRHEKNLLHPPSQPKCAALVFS